MHMPNIPPWLRKVLWSIYAVVVFFLITELQDVFTTAIHPINIQLLNATGYNNSGLVMTAPVGATIDKFILATTLIIVGLTAAWWDNRAQEKIKTERNRADKLIADEKKRYERDIAELLDLCDGLTLHLGLCNIEKKEKKSSMSVSNIISSISQPIKTFPYATNDLLGNWTYEESLYNKAVEVLKKHGKKK
jgi:hypothetical protein